MIDARLEIQSFIESRFPGADLERLAGDASYRIFYRVRLADGQTVVLMDYGSPFAEETDDIRLGRVFRRAGLRVAELLDSLPDIGLLVLEDLGETSLETVLMRKGPQRNDGPPAALVQAVELTARVARYGTPALAASERGTGPALDADRFRFEMDFFLEHFALGLRGLGDPPGELRDELYALADRAATTPTRVLCHRDLHSRNLMVLGDGALAMVDIQDARWGPDSYDLASILRDAYVEIDDVWLESLTAKYLEALADPPEAVAFRQRLDVTSAQRMIKALGSFGYLTVVKHMSRYQDAIPRTLGRLDRLLPSLDDTRSLHAALTHSGLLKF
jgi:aminoglycoside/choline kinase family phosphotransferase